MDLKQPPPSERQLISATQAALRERLPAAWSVDLEARAPRQGPDAFLRLRAPDRRTTRIVVEAKSILNARDVPVVAGQIDRWARVNADRRPALVAARYLSPSAREALIEAGLSYVDLTGNVRIDIPDPAVFIETKGETRDPWRSPDRPTNSLRGGPAARVVRALVDRRPPWRIRELAAFADTSLASTSRTVDFLDREALVSRSDSGAIVEVTWRALIERWAADYELQRKRQVVRALEPRGLDALESKLATSTVDYAVSGSLAARRVAPFAEPRLAVLFVRNSDAALEALGLSESPAASNVIVLVPNDDTPFLRTRIENSVRYAAFSQVAADLLAGPGRNPAEGEELLNWMAANERDWREA